MESTQLGMSNIGIDNTHIWQGLKRAITSSSGFRRWKVENYREEEATDQLVQRYLRKTLETLAY